MHQQLKSAIQTVFPAPFVHLLKQARADMKGRGPRRAFESIGPSGEYLEASMLPLLQKRYPNALPYRYDADALLRRGLERKRQITRFLRVSGARTLELACHDGMVSGLLAHDGAKAIGIDLGIDHFDHRALELGAEAQIMDATRLAFPAGSFDCVFSYNAFEHFSESRGGIGRSDTHHEAGRHPVLQLWPTLPCVVRIARNAFDNRAVLSVSLAARRAR